MGVLKVHRGKIKQPFNILITGVPGVGKTTFAAAAPNPLLIGVGSEETGEQDITRLDNPLSFDELLIKIDELIAAEGDGFSTLILDTLDSIETLIQKKVIAEDPKGAKTIESAAGGFGKGWSIVANEFLKLRDKLKILRDKFGMNLILIAHTKEIQKNDLQLGSQHSANELKLNKASIPIWSDWVSMVGFATFVTEELAGTNTDKIFVTGSGERRLYTEQRPWHPGKNRFSLPYEMPLDFNVFYEAFNKFFESGPSEEGLATSIIGMTENLQDEDLKTKVLAQLTAAKGDPSKLAKIKQRLEEIIQ